jgi:hypothetical protein
MEMFVLLGLFVLLPVGFFITWYQRQAYESMMNQIAQQLGLVVVAGGWFSEASLRGSVGTTSVTVDTETTGTGKHRKVNTRIRLRDETALSFATVRAEGMMSHMGKMVGVSDFHVGDPAFDRHVNLQTSNPSDTLARLGAHARPRVLAAVRVGWSLSGGTWSWRANGMVRSAEELLPTLKVGLAALEATQLPEGAETALWQTVQEDPHPDVRRNALTERLRLLPKPTVDQLEPIAQRGGGEGMVAAAAMGAKGYPWLDRMLGDPEWGIEAALRLARLGRWSNTAEDVAMHGLTGPHVDVAIEALALAGSVVAVQPLSALTGMLSPQRSAAMAAIDAIQSRAKGTFGDLALADITGGELSMAQPRRRPLSE